MESINEKAIHANLNPEYFPIFLDEMKPFLIRSAYRITHKFINEADDEYSIALIAFSDAIKSYNIEKGNFYSFLDLKLKHQLIDFYRSNKKYQQELLIQPDLFEDYTPTADSYQHLQSEISEKLSSSDDYSLTYEIEALSEYLKDFGIDFFSLATSSPKSKKTKALCKKAILFLLNSQELLQELQQKKQLPIKKIIENTLLPRKILERHRNYIIAAVEILSGEYPKLADYLNFIRKEGD